MAGGLPGSVNRFGVERDGVHTGFARTPGHRLRRGDIVRIATGGGGGWGPPSERPPDAVRADVADGLLSAEAAARIYGIDPP
jgi:N-methylhydantoinase B